jgi:hypothetical protein
MEMNPYFPMENFSFITLPPFAPARLLSTAQSSHLKYMMTLLPLAGPPTIFASAPVAPEPSLCIRQLFQFDSKDRLIERSGSFHVFDINLKPNNGIGVHGIAPVDCRVSVRWGLAPDGMKSISDTQ